MRTRFHISEDDFYGIPVYFMDAVINIEKNGWTRGT